MGYPVRLDYLTGFNHGVASISGLGLANALGAAAAIDSSIVRRPGGRSLRFNASAQTANFDKNISVTSTTASAVVYFQWPTSVTVQTNQLQFFTVTGSYFARYESAGTWAINGSGTNNFSFTPSAGVWYRMEAKCDVVAGTMTFSLYLGDSAVALGTSTLTGITNGTSISAIRLGISASTTCDVAWTDLAFSLSDADYPIGPITTFGYAVDAVGTHNLDAATSTFFFKEVSASDTALTTSETTSYQTIDDVPLSADVDCVKIKPTFQTISRPGTATSAAATTVAIPTHATGDLILMHVWRNASSTAPTVPAGWNVLGTSSQGGATKCWAGLYYKIAASSGETSGTWTSATALECEVFRNAQTPVAGDATVTTGVSTSLTYPARTISDTAHSWLSGFSTAASTGCNTTPTGLSISTSYSEVATRGIYSSNGVQGSNFAQATVSVTSEAWGTSMIEVKATLTEPTNTWYAEYEIGEEPIVDSTALGVRAIIARALSAAISTRVVTKFWDGNLAQTIDDSTIATTAKAYGSVTVVNNSATSDNFGTNNAGVFFNIGAANTDQAQAISVGNFGGTNGVLSYVELDAFTTGTPTDSLVVEIQTDSGGVPSGTVVGTSVTVAHGALPTAANTSVLRCYVNTRITSGTATYWIVARRSGAVDAVNFYSLARRTTTYGSSTAHLSSGVWSVTQSGASDVRMRWNTIQPWTRADLASLPRIRFGFTAQADGTPRLEGAMIEVAYQAPLATLRHAGLNYQNPALA